MAQKHLCSLCEGTFTSEEAYLNHKCSETGYTPRDAEHQGPEFAAVSKAATERGSKRKK